jgi:hypothetical protein
MKAIFVFGLDFQDAGVRIIEPIRKKGDVAILTVLYTRFIPRIIMPLLLMLIEALNAIAWISYVAVV